MYELLDYEDGDDVIVHEPPYEDRANTHVFNAGWDSDMDGLEGSHAVVIRHSEQHERRDYLLRFDGGFTWWWDPIWMEPLENREQVSDDDFDAVLN